LGPDSQYSAFPLAAPHLSGSGSQNTGMNNYNSVRLGTPLKRCHGPTSGHNLSLGIAGTGGGVAPFTARGRAWPCSVTQQVQWGCT